MADKNRRNTVTDRVKSEKYQVNLFATADDAEESAVMTARGRLSRTSVYIWLTDDGLYDWSAIPDRLVPWLKTATLVRGPGS